MTTSILFMVASSGGFVFTPTRCLHKQHSEHLHPKRIGRTEGDAAGELEVGRGVAAGSAPAGPGDHPGAGALVSYGVTRHLRPDLEHGSLHSPDVGEREHPRLLAAHSEH